MRAKKFNKVKYLAQEVLLAIQELGEMLPYPLEGRYSHLRRLRGLKHEQVYKTLWRLTDQGLVRKTQKNNRSYYSVTGLGKAKSLRYAYGQYPKKLKTNGLATVVIFDIPEEKRRIRSFLRRFLLEIGFTLLQRSVFIGPWELRSEFRELLIELKINKDVKVIEGRILYV